MEGLREDEPRVCDPSVFMEPDLRLTAREWVLYWRTRYESSVAKIVESSRFIEKLKNDNNELKKENKAYQEKLIQVESQWRAEQKQRQAEAKAEGGAPEIEVKKKKFKRS